MSLNSSQRNTINTMLSEPDEYRRIYGKEEEMEDLKNILRDIRLAGARLILTGSTKYKDIRDKDPDISLFPALFPARAKAMWNEAHGIPFSVPTNMSVEMNKLFIETINPVTDGCQVEQKSKRINRHPPEPGMIIGDILETIKSSPDLLPERVRSTCILKMFEIEDMRDTKIERLTQYKIWKMQILDREAKMRKLKPTDIINEA